MLDLKLGKVPALVDTGAQFSCIGSDVTEYLYLRGEHCVFSLCSVMCLLADGRKGQVSNAAKLHVGLLPFSWNHEFKIFNEDPFPVILGMDFLQRTQMTVDLCSRTYTFAFAPSRVGSFSPAESKEGDEPFLQQLCTDVANITTVTHARLKDLEW